MSLHLLHILYQGEDSIFPRTNGYFLNDHSYNIKSAVRMLDTFKDHRVTSDYEVMCFRSALGGTESMATEKGNTAPYAPIANVLTVIRRFRDHGLPETLTSQELTRIGVPQGNTSRTLQALRFLGLVDDDGNRTEAFERLGKATSEEYPQVFAELVRQAYQDVFKILDPATAEDRNVDDAFRHYEPRAQRTRMVSLFSGLCREAQLMPGGPPAARTRRKPQAGAKPNKQSMPTFFDSMFPFQSHADARRSSAGNSKVDYSVLEALLRQLPQDGRWTQHHRDRWLQALTANLDLLVEVVEGENMK